MKGQIGVVSTKSKQRAHFKQIPPTSVVTAPPILDRLCFAERKKIKKTHINGLFRIHIWNQSSVDGRKLLLTCKFVDILADWVFELSDWVSDKVFFLQ